MTQYSESTRACDAEKICGFPLRAVFYEDGNKFMRAEVKEIRREDLEPSMFDLPEGLDHEALE